MPRFCLTDAQWAKMEPFCLGKPSDPGRAGSDGRLFLEAVLWPKFVFPLRGAVWRALQIVAQIRAV